MAVAGAFQGEGDPSLYRLFCGDNQTGRASSRAGFVQRGFRTASARQGMARCCNAAERNALLPEPKEEPAVAIHSNRGGSHASCCGSRGIVPVL
jgi:hypothetical protein